MERDLNTNMMLKSLKSEDDYTAFLKNSQGGFVSMELCGYFDELMDKHGLKKRDVIEKANLERTYGYQIFSGNRTCNRDKLLCLAIAMSLSMEETLRLLAIAQKGTLYVKVQRDAAIMFCIEKGYDLNKTQIFLEELGVDILE